MIQKHNNGPPMSSLSAWRCMHCWPTCVFMFVHSSCFVCLYIHRTPAQFKPTPSASFFFFFAGGKLRYRCAQQLHGKETQTHPDIISLWSEALNGWINKSLFRIVFGEGIVPAVLPLGPWLELRESTLCNTPGGYEEQMSCLLPSSSRLKAAHTSLKMTSWKVEPQKAPMSIFGRWLAVLKRFAGRAYLLQALFAAARSDSECSHSP